MKKSVARRIYNTLGDDCGGSPSPPGSACRLEFGEPGDDGRPMDIATTDNNDGSDLWLGWRSEWHVFYEAKHARRLAWFILWTWWVKGTWCGLKRRIWYWALHIEVAEMMEAARENAEMMKMNGIKGY